MDTPSEITMQPSRAALLALASKPVDLTPVDCPELGTRVYVAPMTATERDEWEQALGRDRKAHDGIMPHMRAIMVCVCAKDDIGVRLFRLSDYREVAKLPFAALDRINNAAIKVSRLTAEDVEDDVKN